MYTLPKLVFGFALPWFQSYVEGRSLSGTKLRSPQLHRKPIRDEYIIRVVAREIVFPALSDMVQQLTMLHKYVINMEFEAPPLDASGG